MQAGPALRRLEIISLSTHRAASQMPAIGSRPKCPFGRRCPLSELELIKRGWVAEVPFAELGMRQAVVAVATIKSVLVEKSVGVAAGRGD